MPVEGRERGLRSPLEVRFGITTPTYLGVNTQKSAHALLDGEGVEGINLRIKGGRPICRGGQQKVNADTIAAIHGFTDTTSDAGINASSDPDLSGDGTPYGPMYVIGNDALGVEGSFVHIDTDSQVVISTPVEDSARPTALPVRYGDDDVGAISHDETDTEVLTVPGLVSLFALPRTGTVANCTGLLPLGTDLLASWKDSGVAQKVSLWDGSALTLDLTRADFDGSTFLVEFQGTAYLCLYPSSSAVNLVYKRRGAGAWSTIAYPSATAFKAHHAMVFQSRLYIIGDDSGQYVVYSTDGNTLVREHGFGDGADLAQFCIVRGALYYLYSDTLIGKFDGVSWEDEHGEIDTLLTGGLGIVGVHDGANVVYADDSGHLHVFQSDRTNLFNEWTEVLDTNAGVFAAGSVTPPVRVGPAVS